MTKAVWLTPRDPQETTLLLPPIRDVVPTPSGCNENVNEEVVVLVSSLSPVVVAVPERLLIDAVPTWLKPESEIRNVAGLTVTTLLDADTKALFAKYANSSAT